MLNDNDSSFMKWGFDKNVVQRNEDPCCPKGDNSQTFDHNITAVIQIGLVKAALMNVFYIDSDCVM